MTKTSNQSSLADAITNSQHLYEVRLRKGLKKGRADRAGAQRTVADISRKSDKQGDFDFGATNRTGPSRQCPGLARSEGCNAPCFRPATKQLIEVPDHKTRLAAVTLELAYTEGRPIERQMSLSGKFEDLASLQQRVMQSEAFKEITSQKAVEGKEVPPALPELQIREHQ